MSEISQAAAGLGSAQAAVQLDTRSATNLIDYSQVKPQAIFSNMGDVRWSAGVESTNGTLAQGQKLSVKINSEDFLDPYTTYIDADIGISELKILWDPAKYAAAIINAIVTTTKQQSTPILERDGAGVLNPIVATYVQQAIDIVGTNSCVSYNTVQTYTSGSYTWTNSANAGHIQFNLGSANDIALAEKYSDAAPVYSKSKVAAAADGTVLITPHSQPNDLTYVRPNYAVKMDEAQQPTGHVNDYTWIFEPRDGTMWLPISFNSSAQSLTHRLEINSVGEVLEDIVDYDILASNMYGMEFGDDESARVKSSEGYQRPFFIPVTSSFIPTIIIAYRAQRGFVVSFVGGKPSAEANGFTSQVQNGTDENFVAKTQHILRDVYSKPFPVKLFTQAGQPNRSKIEFVTLFVQDTRSRQTSTSKFGFVPVSQLRSGAGLDVDEGIEALRGLVDQGRFDTSLTLQWGFALKTAHRIRLHIPFLSSFMGFYLPQESYKYIPLALFPNLMLNWTLSRKPFLPCGIQGPYGFQVSGCPEYQEGASYFKYLTTNNDSTGLFHQQLPVKPFLGRADEAWDALCTYGVQCVIDVKWMVYKWDFRANIVQFDRNINEALVNTVAMGGLFLHRCGYEKVTTHNVQKGNQDQTTRIPYSLDIGTTAKSVKQLFMMFLPSNLGQNQSIGSFNLCGHSYKKYKCRRMNLQRLQLKAGTLVFPQEKIESQPIGNQYDFGNDIPIMALYLKAFNKQFSRSLQHDGTTLNQNGCMQEVSWGPGIDFNIFVWTSNLSSGTPWETQPMHDDTIYEYRMKEIGCPYSLDLESVSSDTSLISGLNTIVNSPVMIEILGYGKEKKTIPGYTDDANTNRQLTQFAPTSDPRRIYEKYLIWQGIGYEKEWDQAVDLHSYFNMDYIIHVTPRFEVKRLGI